MQWPKNNKVQSIVYHIDPLLEEPASIQASTWVEAIPELTAVLPGYRHIALTQQAGLALEPENPLELVSLVPAKPSLLGAAQSRQQLLRAWLSKHRPGLFISFDPESIPSPGTGNTLLISSAATLLSGGSKGSVFSGLFKKVDSVPGFPAANVILVPSNADKDAISERYPSLASKIEVIYPALQEPIEPLGWSQQEQVKLRYSGGRDYFLFAGELSEEHEPIELLRAYSLLKKWLMTGMPLVLAGAATKYTPTLERLLLTYKYRSDVSVYPDLESSELQELVSAAYALLWPLEPNGRVLAKGEGYPVEWAFNAGVPVLGSDIPAMNELVAGAALLSPPGDLQQQAHSLMMIYKDEQLRNSLIARGRERIIKLNRQNTLMAYASVVRNFCG